LLVDNPTGIHLLMAKHFEIRKRYYKYGSVYMKREKSDLIGFTDNYYAKNLDDIKNIEELYVKRQEPTIISFVIINQ